MPRSLAAREEVAINRRPASRGSPRSTSFPTDVDEFKAARLRRRRTARPRTSHRLRRWTRPGRAGGHRLDRPSRTGRSRAGSLRPAGHSRRPLDGGPPLPQVWHAQEPLEQQLVDCADAQQPRLQRRPAGQALEYFKYAGGQDTESQYSYTTSRGMPVRRKARGQGQIGRQHHRLRRGGAVDRRYRGACPIAFQVASDFRYYQSGVHGTCARPADVNHAVVAVGYGVEKYGLGLKEKAPHFTRNSWACSRATRTLVFPPATEFTRVPPCRGSGAWTATSASPAATTSADCRLRPTRSRRRVRFERRAAPNIPRRSRSAYALGAVDNCVSVCSWC